MNKSERIELLEEAQMDINNAVEKIRQAMGDTPSWRRIESYLISTLEQCVSEENQWIGGANPSNIQSIIEDINNDEA
jgi:hypothetical protein